MTQDFENLDEGRILDEKEVSAVLRRAAELQGDGEAGSRVGLSLPELQQVAREAGIAPEHITAALLELDEGGRRKTDLWGGPFTFSVERIINADVDDVAWEKMVAASRNAFGEIGAIEVRTNVREWSHAGRNLNARVSALKQDGKTHLQISWGEPVLAVPFYTLAVTLSVIMLPVIFESLGLQSFGGVFLYFTIVSALLLLSRGLTSRMVRKKRKMVNDLVRTLTAIVQKPVSADAGQHAEIPLSEASAQKLLDTEDAPSETQSAPIRQQSRA